MLLKILLSIIFITFSSFKYCLCDGLEIPDWDYLMYTQRWPITTCMSWEEENSGHKCNLPSDLSQWTIHGIWPTKTGTDGPNQCSSSIHFDPDQLQPILGELNEHWTNIEANTNPNSFWKHEWDKHGTCASILPQLNSVTNYFMQGLEWNKVYNMSVILQKSKINPSDSGYDLVDIYNAVKSVINKDPSIHCDTDKKTKNSLISEIRICFDKSFELIDCPVALTDNCSKKKPVMYFEKLPDMSPDDFTDYGMDYGENEEQMLESQKMYERGKYLLHFYRFVKFLMWFTL